MSEASNNSSGDRVHTPSPASPKAGRQSRKIQVAIASISAIALIAIGAVVALLITRPGSGAPSSATASSSGSAAPADAVTAARQAACGRLTASFIQSERSPGQWRQELNNSSDYVMKAATDGVFAAQLGSLLKAYQDADAIDRTVDETGYENASLYVIGAFKAVSDTCKGVGVIFTARTNPSADSSAAPYATASPSGPGGVGPVIITGSSAAPGETLQTLQVLPTGAATDPSPLVSNQQGAPPVISSSPPPTHTVGASFAACSYPTSGTSVKPVRPPADREPNAKTVKAILRLTGGDVQIVMDRSKTPCTVGSFEHLATTGYFDGTTCHRLTTGASLKVLQCGDPSGTGGGGPGYSFADETDPGMTYPAGTVAMANSGPNTNGSQFFLVYADSTLPPDYTVFGFITGGLDVLTKIAAVGVRGGGSDGPPADTVKIQEVATAG